MSAPDPALLAMLVCPVTRGLLVHDADAGELVSQAAGLAFPVKDGVPVLIVEDARLLLPLP